MTQSAIPTRQYRTVRQRSTRLWKMGPFLPHSYTREPALPGAEDPYGQKGRDDYADPITGLPCALKQNQLVGVDDAGNPTTVVEITLFVPPTDSIASGDRVSNVTDLETGAVLEPGPVYVRWVRNDQPWGAVVEQEAYLERLQGNG